MGRGERINRMEDVDDFVAAWDLPSHPRNRGDIEMHRTRFGNINSTGQPGNYFGPALSRWHPRFVEAIEHGVRELVLELTGRRGWISYTSCEGHQYGGLDIRPVERYVGLLPRSEVEAQSIQSLVAGIRHAAGPWPKAVSFEASDEILTGGSSPYRTVDVWFRRHPDASWERYFQSLDAAYGQVLQALRALSTRPAHSAPSRSPS
jgi:uncharacterized protein